MVIAPVLTAVVLLSAISLTAQTSERREGGVSETHPCAELPTESISPSGGGMPPQVLMCHIRLDDVLDSALQTVMAEPAMLDNEEFLSAFALELSAFLPADDRPEHHGTARRAECIISHFALELPVFYQQLESLEASSELTTRAQIHRPATRCGASTDVRRIELVLGQLR